MKTTTYKKASREKLTRVLPAVFAAQLQGGVPEPITAVVFRDDVVTGRIARKAIERIGADFGASLVFAARDFTREATELAAARRILVVTSNGSWGGYFWSDERLAHIRMVIATHRPLDDQEPAEPSSDLTGAA